MLSGFFVVAPWFLLSSLFLGEHSGGVLPVRLTIGGAENSKFQNLLGFKN